MTEPRPRARIALLVAATLATSALVGCRRASEEQPPAATPTPTPAPTPTPTTTPAPMQETISADEAVRLNDRGVGLMGKFEFEAAEAAFRQALRGDLDAEAIDEIRVNAAIALMNQSAEGKQEAALDELTAVLARRPDHVRAHYASGLSQLFLGRADRAMPHFSAVAAAAPGDAYAAHYHGQCLELAGRMADALVEYMRSIELDGYLRSPLLGAQRTLVRLDRPEEGAPLLERFQRLAEIPRGRLVEFKYTRMGRLGEAVAIGHEVTLRALPGGSLFDAPRTIDLDLPVGLAWSPRGRTSVTAVDLTGDGRPEIVVAGAIVAGDSRLSALLRIGDDGTLGRIHGHPLAAIEAASFFLWGDLDNDGLVDAVVVTDDREIVMRQSAPGVWEDVTSQSGIESPGIGDQASGPRPETVHGVLADLDHDGDLDVLLCDVERGGVGGGVRLYHNLDGTRFAPHALPIPAESAGHTSGVAQALVADFDGDRDLDLLLIGVEPPHVLLRNDRLWAWMPWPVAGDALAFAARIGVAGDLDGSGAMQAVLVGDGEARSIRVYDDLATSEAIPLEWPGGDLALADLDGNGQLQTFAPDASLLPEGVSMAALRGWSLMTIDPARGPALVLVHDDGMHLLPPGSGRHEFASINFRGRTDPGQSMRSNASGIGTLVTARAAGRWVTRSKLPMSSTPGQSLEPISIGLGGDDAARFVVIDWSDGVFQSEIDLGPGAHTVVETQRQISSCPLLFVWDGERFEFVSDFLGVGGMGYLIAPGTYAESRPWENYLIPEGLAAERDGAYEMRLHEPMEEAVYLDQVRLHAIDLPPGWSVTIDERMGLGEPMPTGEIVTYRHAHWPVAATDQDGADVVEALRAVDFVAAAVPEADTRWLGRLVRESVLTLEFDDVLTPPSPAARPVLVGTGWVEYPYSQTNFAAWQAGIAYEPPLIEVRDGDGQWHVVVDRTGYPAGMPREMSWPLPPLPDGADAIRLSTTLEIHWDALRLVWAESCAELVRHDLSMISADLRHVGYPRRSVGPSRLPHYDYDTLDPLADMRTQPGYYTNLGPVLPLLRDLDDALVVYAPGEEVAVRFDASAPGPPPEWTRRLVLETHGWCKDMDLFTRDGRRVEPIPSMNRDGGEARERLHREYLQRWEGGR